MSRASSDGRVAADPRSLPVRRTLLLALFAVFASACATLGDDDAVPEATTVDDGADAAADGDGIPSDTATTTSSPGARSREPIRAT
jgi:hypothetical protein